MEYGRSCLFPLRTNAAFYRTRGALRLNERLKVAAILYDELILEDEMYVASVGERSSIQLRFEASRDNVERYRRLKSRGARFAANIGRTGAQQMHPLMDFSVERQFVSENRSFLVAMLNEAQQNSLPSWVRVFQFEASNDTVSDLRERAQERASSIGNWRRKGSATLRELVHYNFEHDLELGAAVGAFVSMDAYFAALARHRSGLESKHGPLALQALLPNFGSLSWREVFEFKEHPAIDAFRSKLAELEEEARSNSDKREFKYEVAQRAAVDLAQKWQAPSKMQVAGKLVVDVIVGSIPVVGPAASAAFSLGDAASESHGWGALFFKIAKAAG